MFLFEIFTLFATGLILGSFATAISYRAPREIPWAFGNKRGEGDVDAYRSACTSCKTKLIIRDLVPLFSWLFNKGRCRHCKESIGTMYPLIELGVLLSCFGAYAVYGWSVETLFIISLVPFLWALLAIDLEFMILPNHLVGIVAGLGVVRLIADIFVLETYTLDHALTEYVLASAIYGGFSWGLGALMGKLLKKDALGFGDVKFFAAVGLWLGIGVLPYFCIASGALLIAMAGFWQVIVKQRQIPFGPALIVAFYSLLLIDGSLLP